jgi:hypothetical protein
MVGLRITTLIYKITLVKKIIFNMHITHLFEFKISLNQVGKYLQPLALSILRLVLRVLHYHRIINLPIRRQRHRGQVFHPYGRWMNLQFFF